MVSQEELINAILAKWNPIGVPDNISKVEYRSYIPLIKSSMNSETTLINCLENILIDKMELGYKRLNSSHKKDLKEVAMKILKLK